MNRRQFNIGLAAAATTPVIPLKPAMAAPLKTAPPMAYLFGELIARARGEVDAGFLARRLSLTTDMAQGLMKELAENGVIGRVGVTGAAQALNPMQLTAQSSHTAKAAVKTVTKHVENAVKAVLEDEDQAQAPDEEDPTSDPSGILAQRAP